MRVGPSVLHELGVVGELRRLRNDPIFAGQTEYHGDGAPVIVVPGFACSDATVRPIHSWLRRLGYASYPTGLRNRHLDCGEVNAQTLLEQVERVAREHGRPVQLLGYSRGGHPARVVALRRPELVRGLVTLGTPSLDPRTVHLLMAFPASAVVALGSARVPGLMGLSCLFGSCCRQFRVDLNSDPPTGIDYVALHSPRDGIVDHRYTPDRGAQVVEVNCSHVGYIANREVYSAVAQALAISETATR